jgi:hypothetical protein
MKGVGEPQQNNQLDKNDFKNADMDHCDICGRNIPASVQYSRVLSDYDEPRMESISVCHICSGLGEKELWDRFEKKEKEREKENAKK